MTGQEDELVRRAQQRIGSVISGKWTIDRLIGMGGMGAVYAATHRNKKKAAIKMLHPELSVDANIKERFLREGYVANSVEHAGSVRIDDDDIAEDGSAYLVMELLDGESVDARWERQGQRLPLGEVLSVAEQLLDVLVAAHAAGIVHRDLKPENVFLTRSGQLKVLDFGIARIRQMGDSSKATKTGTFMGTPAFMAPEQARGRWESVDHRTDLWAVGATMYTLLTGRCVHEGGTVNETLALAMTRPAPSISQTIANLPTPVVELIDKSLAYHMEERFPNAASMQQAVRDAARGTEDAPSLTGEVSTAPTLAAAGIDAVDVAVRAQSANAKGSGATAAGVTKASPDSEPTAPSKRSPVLLAVVAVGAVAVVGVVLAVSGSDEGSSTPGTAAEPTPAAQVEEAEPPAPAPEVAPVIPEPKEQKADTAEPDSPAAQDQEQKKEAVPTKRAPVKVVHAPKPERASASAQPTKPTPQKPKPARDPFSVRK